MQSHIIDSRIIVYDDEDGKCQCFQCMNYGVCRIVAHMKHHEAEVQVFKCSQFVSVKQFKKAKEAIKIA